MDQSTQVLTQEEKTKIYDLLADAYLHYPENNDLNTLERKTISRKILEQVDLAITYSDIENFLSALSNDYGFFQPALTHFKAELNQQKEAAVIGKLQQYINSFKTN